MNVSAYWKTWDLTGLEVTQLRFDYQFHVHMWAPQRDLLITFGAPFMLWPADGSAQNFDPEQNEKLSKLLKLLHKPVKSFAASSGGHCILEFEDGTQLRGEPHEKYEAWESHGSGDLEGASLLCGIK